MDHCLKSAVYTLYLLQWAQVHPVCERVNSARLNSLVHPTRKTNQYPTVIGGEGVGGELTGNHKNSANVLKV